jgi:hypothetical protein
MKITFVILTLLAYKSLSSQNSFNSSGSILSFSENSFSYSIGQVFSDYTTPTGFLFTQGVQHPVFSVSSHISNPEMKNDLKIDIFPNPFNQYIVIELNKPESCILKIYNSLGKIVMEKKLSSISERIETTAFASSIYYLSIISKDKIILTHKFIKYEE